MNHVDTQLMRLGRRFLSGASSRKFITGDGFKNLCEFSVESQQSFSNSNFVHKIISAKSIFIKGDLYEHFYHEFGDLLNAKFIFVGNSDQDFKQVALPESVISAYFQNLLVPISPRLSVLPIGIENLSLWRSCPAMYRIKPKAFHEKSEAVLIGPYSPTHQDRIEIDCMSITQKDSFHISKGLMSAHNYLKQANDFKFIAAPRGNGEDTHRFWEALYLNSIPIVKESTWAQNMRLMGVPCITVPSWNEDSILESVSNFDSTNQNNYKRILDLKDWAKSIN